MADSTQRSRALGVTDASLLVVGSIVGGGIFLVSPAVARNMHAPAVFLATWLLGGAVALAGALSNGELGGLFPRSGGEYVYLREAYGPAVGFLSGWSSFWIVFPGSIAALAAGFGATLAAMLELTGAFAQLAIGIAAIAALTLVNSLGLRTGKWTQNVLSAAKLLAFFGLLALGCLMPHGNVGGLTPFLVAGDRPSGIAQGLVPVLFAYSGWNAATYVAGEMRDPTHGLGRALVLGTALCVALYVAVNTVYLRAMPMDDLARANEPARATAMLLGGRAAAAVLSPLVALCVLSSMQASVLVGPRIYRAMANDGLFFAPLGRLNARTGAPLPALLAQSAVAVVQLVSGSFDQLLTFTTFAIVAFSMLTVAAVFVLRVRQPAAPRPFCVPAHPWIPVFFILVNGWVLWAVAAGDRAHAALIGLGIVATGLPAYFVFRARKRRLESR